jgi:hypothetical protein
LAAIVSLVTLVAVADTSHTVTVLRTPVWTGFTRISAEISEDRTLKISCESTEGFLNSILCILANNSVSADNESYAGCATYIGIATRL